VNALINGGIATTRDIVKILGILSFKLSFVGSSMIDLNALSRIIVDFSKSVFT
jgi:hypothetical protein